MRSILSTSIDGGGDDHVFLFQSNKSFGCYGNLNLPSTCKGKSKLKLSCFAVLLWDV